MDRRQFLKNTAALTGMAAIYASCQVNGKTYTGSIVGQNSGAGHLFRDRKMPEASSFTDHDTVVIGGGISGLSAARALTMAGQEDILMLEMEDATGGNSKSDKNEVSAYPFGAHYLPIPNTTQTPILDFLQRCGVINGCEDNLPVYNELYLCHEPEDRLYINNYWQEGVVPQYGLSKAEEEQMVRFLQCMDNFRWLKGSDNRYLFDIPISNVSVDTRLQHLDTITLAAWLQENGFDSRYLLGYLNYAMKDDFGTGIAAISAWVGIQYFAGRKGRAANAESSDVLTWPAGNGFLAQQLLDQSKMELRKTAMVYAVRQEQDAVYLSYFDTRTQQIFGIRAQQVVAAIPAFIFQRMIGNHELAQIPYSPWMIANLKVRNDLVERRGARMSWDNVLYDSESLGYINNNHQLLNRVHPWLNLTYYRPFATGDLKANRQKVLDTKYEDWVRMVIDDLKVVHPNIEDCLSTVDIHLWGHAMVQPQPGWIFGSHRQQLAATGTERIHLAHTDYAGNSIFEEAFYQGWAAANNILKAKNRVS